MSKRASKLVEGATRGTYSSWLHTVARCCDPKHIKYPWYGGRSGKPVLVHPPWITSFKVFFDYMGNKPSAEYTLDRYPIKDGDYVPGNVRWASPEQQAENRRNAVLLSFKGETKTLRAWGRYLDLDEAVIRRRLKMGVSNPAKLLAPAPGKRAQGK